MSTIERDVRARAEMGEALREKEEEIAELRARLAEWEEAYDGTPKREALFTTVSGREVRPLLHRARHPWG